MKKTLTAAALSSLLVLGLASSALALHATATAEQPIVAAGASKVTIDGTVRQRGYYDRDLANPEVAGSNGKSGYDSRVQLGVKAQVSPEATGYVKLESGDAANSDIDVWGAGTAAGLHTGGDKMGALTILEAWVNYQPGMWGVKAGHMPLALGNKMFFDHTGSGDDALVFYANLNEATHIAGLTIKFDETTTGGVYDDSSDLDGYVALITHKLSDSLNLGANWTYLRGGAEAGLAIPAGAFDPATGDLLASPTTLGYELAAGMSMSNIGLTADGKVGAISYLADLEMQFGDVANYDNGAADTITVDAGGWAAKVGVNYDLGGGKVGLLVGYGSGDDDQEHNDDLADADNDLDHEAFINFLTDTTYDTIIAGYRAAIPGANSWAGAAGAGGAKNTGLSNLTLLQLNGSTKVVCPLTGKDLSLFASASYMQLSEDMINGTQSDGTDNEVDNVGSELDLVATWALTAGLNYRVEAAYMWTGEVYEVETLGNASDTDDLAFIRHSLDLKF